MKVYMLERIKESTFCEEELRQIFENMSKAPFIYYNFKKINNKGRKILYDFYIFDGIKTHKITKSLCKVCDFKNFSTSKRNYKHYNYFWQIRAKISNKFNLIDVDFLVILGYGWCSIEFGLGKYLRKKKELNGEIWELNNESR